MIKSKDEILIFAGASKKQIGRLLNGVLQDIYWKYGGERILAKLANVKYLNDNTRKVVEGTLEIVEEGSEVGLKSISKLLDDIDKTITRLSSRNVKYLLDKTGEYRIVFGHHPLAKSAFRDYFQTEAAFKQYYEEAFSIATEALRGKTVHNAITGQQKSLYTAWRKANPNVKLTIDAMTDIEIRAMNNAGIPEDVATGWILKALEKLKSQGISDITNVP